MKKKELVRYKPGTNYYADYAKDGEFFGEINAPINVDSLQRYAELHGEDRAAGYVDAIQDFQREIRAVAWDTLSPDRMKNYIRALWKHNNEFLKGLNEKPDSNSENQPLI